MIDSFTIFLSSFAGAMCGVLFAKMIELWQIRKDIKRKKEEIAEMLEMTEKLAMLIELEEKAKKNENNKTRKKK